MCLLAVVCKSNLRSRHEISFKAIWVGWLKILGPCIEVFAQFVQMCRYFEHLKRWTNPSMQALQADSEHFTLGRCRHPNPAILKWYPQSTWAMHINHPSPTWSLTYYVYDCMTFFQPANHVSRVFQGENIEEQVQDLKTFLVGHVVTFFGMLRRSISGANGFSPHLARKSRPFSLSNSMWSILAPTPSLPRTCTAKDMMRINWIHIKSYHIIIILHIRLSVKLLWLKSFQSQQEESLALRVAPSTGARVY